ncbi:6-hydroxymethylpterin diphosphokinase MptE-like protein [Butyrivibrio sp. INlla16]|uniref:6-hydroxymethylpterin diphosphokinase MptE-like protein n=1 Tax=Butyrivibrio sp. INlla16 TaxID=1520807 RepID=UPI00088659B2|nr:6-hydroxymethylpterin diphosphokinase MptE-like protein [Butyrivibrio sp. INlla16]SDB09823.1 Protein of unknown function DUF115 [Butyrivibrio sp. INlla16]
MNVYQVLRDIKDSRYFRLLLCPYGMHHFKKENTLYSESEFPEIIKRFKNIHDGERCFIIGNGPSLTPEDLQKIKNEYSFAANKIYNIYSKTSWRPTYYVCMDSMSIVEEIGDEIDKVSADYMFINWQQRGNIPRDEKIILCNANPRYVVNFWDDKKVTFSEDCSCFIDNARTVTYTSIQLAVYMGFKEIYLLGVDANYPFYRDGKGRKHTTGVTKSHFENGGYKRIDYLVKETNDTGYKVAREYCEKNGIKIFNATRGGKLEIFTRVDFDEIDLKRG